MLCPFCKEEIKDGAILCKFCKSNLSEKTENVLSQAPPEPVADFKKDIRRSQPYKSTAPINNNRILLIVLSCVAIAVVAFIILNSKSTKEKMKITMGDMKTLGSAIESYITDWSFAPQVESIEDLSVASWFVPFYIKVLPTEDAWGNSFLYKHGIPLEGSGDDYEGDIYAIASTGSDGRFGGFDQKGGYIDWENEDIIYSNGVFTYSLKIER